MTQSHDPLDSALRDLASSATVPDHHPSAEQLVAYHQQELDKEATEGLRAHLASCSSCTRVILDLAAPPVDDPELDAAWRGLVARREGQPTGPRQEPPTALFPNRAPTDSPPTPAQPAGVRPRWLPLAAVLTLLLTSTLLAALLVESRSRALRLEERLASLEGELDTLRRPQAAVASATLLPEGFLRDSQPTLDLSADKSFLVLTLAGADPPADIPHRLELLDTSGREIWRGDSLLADDRGHFTLVLPTSLLPPGPIELNLLAPGAAEPVSYRLWVDTVAPGDPDGTIPPP